MFYRVFFIFFFCFIASCAVFSQEEVHEVALKKGFFEEFYPIVGNTKPSHFSKISSQVTGRVKEVFIEAGQRVEKGEGSLAPS